MQVQYKRTYDVGRKVDVAWAEREGCKVLGLGLSAVARGWRWRRVAVRVFDGWIDRWIHGQIDDR